MGILILVPMELLVKDLPILCTVGMHDAVYYASEYTSRISSSRFSGNTATLSGGILNIDGKSIILTLPVEIFNSSFSFNSARRYTGSLYSTNGDILISCSNCMWLA